MTCLRPRALRPLRTLPPAAGFAPPVVLTLALTLALSLAAAPARARCVDEDRLGSVAAAEAAAVPGAEPRATLRQLADEAVARSNPVGASALLAEAALADLEETLAAKKVQASVSAGAGPGGALTLGVNESSLLQLRGGFNMGQLLWDGGRTDRLAEWRQQLAEAARYGTLNLREQLTATTVALALERSRFRQQVLVYGQYVRKMECLTEALETIVRADRGRTSELVQAKKTLQQAQLAQVQAQAQVRQVEVRLRRLVGDGLPGTEGLASVFVDVPELRAVVSDVERSYEVAQADAAAAAANRYAEAVAAGGRPQLSWAVNGSAFAGAGTSGTASSNRSANWSVGLAVTVPLLAPNIAPATDAARKRAQAAALQRDEALHALRWRAAELHEQATSSVDRARRLAAVLRDSDQLRNFTLQQWQQLGRRSLFDVMGAESEHYSMRVAYVNALHDVQQLNANLLSVAGALSAWLR